MQQGLIVSLGLAFCVSRIGDFLSTQLTLVFELLIGLHPWPNLLLTLGCRLSRIMPFMCVSVCVCVCVCVRVHVTLYFPSMLSFYLFSKTASWHIFALYNVALTAAELKKSSCNIQYGIWLIWRVPPFLFYTAFCAPLSFSLSFFCKFIGVTLVNKII